MRPETPSNRRRDFSRGEQHGLTRRAMGQRGGYFSRGSHSRIMSHLDDHFIRASADFEGGISDHNTKEGIHYFLREIGFSDEESRLIYGVLGADTIPAYARFIAIKDTVLEPSVDPNAVFYAVIEAQDLGLPGETVAHPARDARKSIDVAMLGHTLHPGQSLPGGYESSSFFESISSDNNIRD